MPEELKKYFWDTQFEKLDIRKNKKYIISKTSYSTKRIRGLFYIPVQASFFLLFTRFL